jgi:poly-beta-1,6-N-acetyl-D-glucosamine synthase
MSEQQRPTLTVLIPAYNEEPFIADTIRSLQVQTHPPDEILVVDDCSADGTAEVARSCGARVLRPARNTGAKAGAQNYGLSFVHSQYVLSIDGDTTLAPDAIEKIMPALEGEGVAAACGFVLPRNVSSVWERGRFVEYLFGFSFGKRMQAHFGQPMVASGCFSVYDVATLKRCGGWPERTRAEDMDLTWTLYEEGHAIRFVPEAVSYPIEPHDFGLLKCQLRRWSHGFVQNILVHWDGMRDGSFLRWMVAVALWDGLVASALYALVLPLLAILLGEPRLLLGYLLDVPALLVPVLFEAIPRRKVLLALTCLPAFFIMRAVNALFLLEAVWDEVIVRKPLLVFEKGH